MAKRRTTIIIEEEIGLENTKSVFVNEEKATEVKETKAKKSTSKSKSKTTKTKSSKGKTKSTTSKTKSSSKKGTKKKATSKKSSKKSSTTKNKDKEVKENTSLEQVDTKENLKPTSNSIKELPSPLQEETSKKTKNELTIKEEDKLTPSLLDKAKDNKETITDPEIIDPIKEDIDNKENKDKEDLDVIDATIIEKEPIEKNIDKEDKEESSKTNLPKEKEDKSKDKEEKNLPTNKEDDLDKSKEQESKDTALPERKEEDSGTSKDEENKEEKETKNDKKTATENTIIVPETLPTKEEISTTSVTEPLPDTSSQSQEEKDNKQDSKKIPLSIKLNPLSLIKLFSKSKYKGVIIGTTILVILVAILVPISINLLNKDPYKEINKEDINKDYFISKDEFFNEVASFDLKLTTSKYNDVTSDGYLLSAFNKVNDIYSFSYESRFDDLPESSIKGGPIVYKIEITLDEGTNKYKIDNYEDSTLVNTSSLSESEAISYIKEYVNLFYDSYLIYDSEYLKGIIEEGKESNSSPKYFINEETSEIKLNSSPSDIYEFNYDQNGIIKDGIYATSIKESKDNTNSETNKIFSEVEFQYALNS